MSPMLEKGLSSRPDRYRSPHFLPTLLLTYLPRFLDQSFGLTASKSSKHRYSQGVEILRSKPGYVTEVEDEDKMSTG